MLTVEDEGQNTHNYADQCIGCRGTFVRVECETNDGIHVFGCFYWPEVKA